MKIITMEDAAALITKAETMTSEEIAALQKERLHELVDYVREHSVYFKEHYKALGKSFELEDLPYTEKKDLMMRYEDWVTDKEITREGVAEYLDSQDRGVKLFLGKYSALTTSGTTGSPMFMVRDSYHNMIHGAMIQKRLFKRVNSDLMDARKHKIASIIYKDPHVSSYSSFLRAKEALGEFRDNMIAISPDEKAENMVEILNSFQPEFITCYPSAMCVLALEQEKGNLHITLKGIACSAETLTPEMCELFIRVFKCPIINNYCSTEGGEAAMSSTCEKLHINTDWVLIEPVDSNRQVISDENVWSDGIFITDLTNYVQPIIRYYMNDSVRIHPNCKCGNHFPVMEIKGRTGGVAFVCGQPIPIVSFYAVGVYIEHAYVLQTVQTGDRTFEIRGIYAPEADKNAIFTEAQARLRQQLSKAGCIDFDIIRSEKEPAKNEKGGKFPYYIKLYR